MRTIRWLPLVCLCGLVGCQNGDDTADTAAVDTLALAQANAARTATLLAPVRSVGEAVGELSAGAAQRAEREDVRRYAQVVAADHRAVNSTLDSVIQTLDVTYEPTASARDLEEAVRVAHSGLETLTGSDYDLAFIRAQVESHRLLLDRMDQEVIPDLRGAELRDLLQQVRAMTDAHLTRARQLLATQLGRPDPTSRAAPRPRADTVRRPPPDTATRRPRPDTLNRS